MRTLGMMVLSALVAGVVATSVASAGQTSSVPQILGHGGSPPPLDSATCHRQTYNLAEPFSWRHGGRAYVAEAFNIFGNQVRCLVRLEIARMRCVHREDLPTIAKGHTHPDGTSDWSNVDVLRDRLEALRDCLIAARVAGLAGS